MRGCLPLALFLALLLAGGCSASPAALVDGDQEAAPVDGDREEVEDGDREPVWPDGDDDTVEDGDLDREGEGEAEQEAEIELEQEEEAEAEREEDDEPELAEPLIPPRTDSRLYAAAATVEITPTEANHPCTQYLAGRTQNRKPKGVHTPLTARSLILAQEDRYLVLVVLDVIGLSQADSDRMAAAFPPGALASERLVLASTHTHSGPDTLGLWGPNYLHTGRCEAYIDHLATAVRDLVEQSAAALVPVSLRVAVTQVYEAGATRPRLMLDTRFPYVFNEHYTLLRLTDDDEQTVATLANWHSHPEIMVYVDRYSADWPHYLREALERRLGGRAIYASGTLGGLLTSYTQGIEVPSWNAEGERVEVDGAPVYVKTDGQTKARSLGYELADYAVRALADVEPQQADLYLSHRTVLLPITNTDIRLAWQAGLVTISDHLVLDQEEICGPFACLAQPLLHARLGNLHLVTLPGEVFPESSVGRSHSERDYGEPWGAHVFEALTGYRAALPEGHALIELGLANNEIGYIVPASDFHPKDHPNYYEETSAIGLETERLIREAVRDLIGIASAF